RRSEPPRHEEAPWIARGPPRVVAPPAMEEGRWSWHRVRCPAPPRRPRTHHTSNECKADPFGQFRSGSHSLDAGIAPAPPHRAHEVGRRRPGDRRAVQPAPPAAYTDRMPRRVDDYRGLTQVSRLRLLQAVQRKPGRRLSDLAEAAGVHINTARDHLRVLEDEGLVVSAPVDTGRRGRPPLGYSPVTRAEHSPQAQ